MRRMKRAACFFIGPPATIGNWTESRFVPDSKARHSNLFVRIRKRVKNPEGAHAPLAVFQDKFRAAEVMLGAVSPVAPGFYQKRHGRAPLFAGDAFRVEVPDDHFRNVPATQDAFQLLAGALAR